MKKFPRTEVAGLSLPRMIIGTNWFLGWSHRGAAADRMIQSRFEQKEVLYPILKTYMDYGIDAVMAPLNRAGEFLTALDYAQEKLGKKFILIDTPVMDVNDTKKARKNAAAAVKASKQMGADICLMHHSSAEQLVNKNKETIERLPDYLYMMRENGLLPGLSAHMPEIVLYSDANAYDVETYIQIFNCAGFLMPIEIEAVGRIIHSAKRPVITIKPFAAGRITPYVGLTFNWAALRPCDMITAGVMTADEVHENVEISFAAFEKRYPNIGKRSSPAADQSVLNG